MTTLPPPSLSRILARKIIEQVGSSGQPPEEGLHHFSVGLESYLRVMRLNSMSLSFEICWVTSNHQPFRLA